jgi:tetratricopeptide (TPR) repeat protein
VTTVLALTVVLLAVQSLPNVPPGAEAVSLFGKPLARPTLSEEALKKAVDDLARAHSDFDKEPTEDNAVWIGRRLGYLGRYRDAIEFFSAQIANNPRSAKFLRHRGHRYITIREFGRAVADFERAAELIQGTKDEVEPDGAPNAKNIPLTSLHSNVWYHLALARYLNGDFKGALSACDEGMKVSGNPDRLVSQTYWKYLCLRKLGRDEEARRALSPITAEMELIENHAYHRLLLVFKGVLTADDVLKGDAGEIGTPTIAFGLGMFAHFNGNAPLARAMLETARASGSWAAFGFIAAEAELKRMSSNFDD